MTYLFDTDPGIDDAVAITLALAGGDDVAGLCTVAGNVDEPLAAASAASLLAALGRQDVPLHRGAPLPLLRERVAATHVHGADGLGGALPRVEPPDGGPSAVERLLGFSGHLVAIGPLTNLATAVLCDRTWPARVPHLTIMGGALAARGNAGSAAEFNFFCDPEAADIVLAAGFRAISLVPLEVQDDLRMGPAELARLDGLHSRSADVVRRLLQPWRGRVTAGGAAIYDAVAWMAARHPEIFSWEEAYVRVDLGRGLGYGASLADRRPGAPAPNLRAYAGCDVPAYWERFFATLA